MKRFFGFLGAAVLVVLVAIAAYQNYTPVRTSGSVPDKLYTEEIVPVDGLRLEIVDGSVTPSGVTAIFINDGSCNYIYGEGFSLQKQVDGQWYTMSGINENTGFLGIGYILEPGRAEMEYPWEFMYGKMEPGDYRIVTDIFSEKDYNTRILLEARFTIE